MHRSRNTRSSGIRSPTADSDGPKPKRDAQETRGSEQTRATRGGSAVTHVFDPCALNAHFVSIRHVVRHCVAAGVELRCAPLARCMPASNGCQRALRNPHGQAAAARSSFRAPCRARSSATAACRSGWPFSSGFSSALPGVRCGSSTFQTDESKRRAQVGEAGLFQ